MDHPEGLSRRCRPLQALSCSVNVFADGKPSDPAATGAIHHREVSIGSRFINDGRRNPRPRLPSSLSPSSRLALFSAVGGQADQHNPGRCASLDRKPPCPRCARVRTWRSAQRLPGPGSASPMTCRWQSVAPAGTSISPASMALARRARRWRARQGLRRRGPGHEEAVHVGSASSAAFRGEFHERSSRQNGNGASLPRAPDARPVKSSWDYPGGLRWALVLMLDCRMHPRAGWRGGRACPFSNVVESSRNGCDDYPSPRQVRSRIMLFRAGFAILASVRPFTTSRS